MILSGSNNIIFNNFLSLYINLKCKPRIVCYYYFRKIFFRNNNITFRLYKYITDSFYD